jgi:hypothetical protein
VTTGVACRHLFQLVKSFTRTLNTIYCLSLSPTVVLLWLYVLSSSPCISYTQ